MLIGGHLEPHDFARIHVDDDALDHGDILVAHERILPRLKLGMRVGHGDQVHLAGVALILLEGGNLRRIRRPEQNGLSEDFQPALSVA